ncbi:MAG: B12-binding domain-containing radical SAM protein, partial [Spirochaetes bacterium]|nr:B12-binding domain-containing radical SAM protein [Spirochaetota bacterium]
MKLLLINPSKYDEKGNLIKFKLGSFPPLNLLILASLVKKYPQVKTKIVDEFIEDIPFKEDFDMVGITTVFSSTFPRVIDISNYFRSRNIPVILGGTHATCNYQECLPYADSIVVAEAEKNFELLIDDFLTKKKIKKIYKNNNFVDLTRLNLMLPDYSLIDTNRYMKVGFGKKSNYFAIEASRGCPLNCTFCSVKVIHGTRQRCKPVSHVIQEIRDLKKIHGATLFNFTDDNFLYNQSYFKELLKELAKEEIKFHCEVSTTIISHSDLLSLLKKAGCISTFIGFESLNHESLISVKKSHNQIIKYKEIFEIFKRYNIPICPAFIFGFDFDDLNSFSHTLNFLDTVTLQRAIFSILTPFPGTEFYRKMI